VFHPIVIVREGRPGVVGRVNEDEFHLPGELLLQRLQREKVVAEDEPVVENVVIRDTLCSVITLFGIFEKYSRFELRSIFFANPGQF
jgi:hypothetical protein